jgi:hypothetical protein
VQAVEIAYKQHGPFKSGRHRIETAEYLHGTAKPAR